MKAKIFTLALLLIGLLGFSQQTSIPDANFEQVLIDLGYDSILDGYVTTANISGIATLNIEYKRITDLTGIEDFRSFGLFPQSINHFRFVSKYSFKRVGM